MQSYSVGYSEDLKYWDNPASPGTDSTFGSPGSGPMGVIIPTLRDHTCLKSADESASITQTDIVDGNNIFARVFSPTDMDGVDDYGFTFTSTQISS